MTNDARDAFAREIIALARQYKVTSVAVQYRDKLDSPLRGQHTITWSDGRHGAANNISLSYQDTKVIAE